MATWRGSTGVFEDPCSPEIVIRQDGRHIIRTFNGPYSILEAFTPNRGDFRDGGQVDTVNLKHGVGGKGTLIVDVGPIALPGIADPVGVLEIEWLEVQKRLEQHPRYKLGGAAQLTNADLDAIEEWRSLSTATQRAAKFATLSINAQEFVSKVNRGQDSFVLYGPVSRQTIRSTIEPISEPCGVIQSPPPDIAVDGYQYLKTADRVQGQGTHWEQIREWTGADEWDSQIYPFG
jgi:hypothetical protein